MRNLFDLSRNTRAFALLAFAVSAGSSGCAEKEEPAGQPVATEAGQEGEAAAAAPASDTKLNPRAAFLTLLDNQCGSCHLEDEVPELHGNVNLTELLEDEEWVDLSDRKKSVLYGVVAKDPASRSRMPRSRGKEGDASYLAPLTMEEQKLFLSFVMGDLSAASEAGSITKTESGAKSEKPAETESKPPAPAPPSREFVALEDILDAIVKDLQDQREETQRNLRYLSLANLYNIRNEDGNYTDSDDMLNRYRAAVSKFVNSISTHGTITIPKTVDENRLIFRVDLRDYNITHGEWEHIVEGYPYGILDVDGRKERLINEYTGSAAPYLRADWFVFACSQPPLYHELLNIPDNDRILEEHLGVNVVHNLQEGHAIRAGFRNSGVSQANRLIERHELGSHRGMYWKSYDFSALHSQPNQDMFRAPLGPIGAGLTDDRSLEFEHDGGEIIFSLPNGLLAYMLSTAAGDRLSRAPSDIVQDDKRPDGIIINGISCMSCHSEGSKTRPNTDYETFRDEIGPIVLKAGLPFREMRHVEKLYAKPEELKSILLQDRENFLKALAQATPEFVGQTDTVQHLYKRFKRDITASQLASEVGDDLEGLLEELYDQDDRDLRLIAAQLESGIAFPRQFFLTQFQSIVHALAYRTRTFRPIPLEEFGGINPEDLTVTHAAPQAANNHSKDGKLTISTDKLHYRDGEYLTVTVRVKHDTYLRLYHQGVDGTVQEIFPNQFQKDNFVRAGQSVQIPGGNEDFQFQLHAPFGEEVIVAVGSPVQFADYQPDGAYVAKKGLRIGDIYKRGTRGLTVVSKGFERPAKNSIATAVFSISK